MQSWRWYLNRLQSMSPAEVLWRVGNAARDRTDRLKLAAHQRRLAERSRRISDGGRTGDGYRPTSAFFSTANRFYPDQWRSRLWVTADEILAQRVRLFGTEPTNLGTPIRWNYEYNKNAPTPTDFIGHVDYRDYQQVGDCKWVWELSRHHHLVVLGRAYAIAGDERYAQEVVRQIKSWIDASPYGTGMNWRSPLELGIRLINWVWALDLIDASPALESENRNLIGAFAEAHIWEVARKYSKYSSANNHLIGEAAGVYVGAAYFDATRAAARYRADAKQILIDEMAQQVDDDGIHKELALGYHVFVLQFFLLAWHAGQRSNDPFPAAFTDKLRKMADTLQIWLAAGGEGVQYGDADDGYVLDLGGARGDASGWVAATHAIVNDSATTPVEAAEHCIWLTSDAATDRPESSETKRNSSDLESHQFATAGLNLLQANVGPNAQPVSVTFDACPLGYKSIAAHGHADALSITMRYNGAAFFVDPGTYDYFTYDDWRNYFRSTRAHNTVEVDGCDQSEMLGKFLWGARATTQVVEWQATNESTRVAAEHDGYQRLSDPVTHRRTVELSRSDGTMKIDDAFTCAGPHSAVLHFHCAPNCQVTINDDRTLTVARPEGRLRLSLPDGCDVRTFCGETDPIRGWFSPAYHQKVPATTIVASFKFNGSKSVSTLVQILGP